MGRTPQKSDKNKSEFKVVKKCQECSKEIPVACKTCPLCKSPVITQRNLKQAQSCTDDDKDLEGKIRRTERIRRERPDFFNSVQLENEFKIKRKRKESVSSTVSLTSVEKCPQDQSNDKISPKEEDVPRRKRGRPKSVSLGQPEQLEKLSGRKSPQSPSSEEDWFSCLPPEKIMQYKIILAEINRKFCTQNFNPI